jgi:hypothetical protein
MRQVRLVFTIFVSFVFNLKFGFFLQRRSLSSGSVDGCCAMLNHSVAILESSYKDALYSKLKAGYPSGFDLSQAYNVIQSSFQQGKLQSSDHLEKQKFFFLVSSFDSFFGVIEKIL